MRKVAIFMFDDVEVLDFAGPFEVFGVSFDADGNRLFDVCTVAEKSGAINARNGLSVNPTYTFETLPQPDILLIPGGSGTRPLVENETNSFDCTPPHIAVWQWHTSAGRE